MSIECASRRWWRQLPSDLRLVLRATGRLLWWTTSRIVENRISALSGVGGAMLADWLWRWWHALPPIPPEWLSHSYLGP